MPWVKIVNRKSHSFTSQLKVYGVSLEAILISSFIIIVLFLLAVHIKQPAKKNKPGFSAAMHQPAGADHPSPASQPVHKDQLTVFLTDKPFCHVIIIR